MFCGWIVLSGKLDPFYLALGAVSCVIVTILSTDLIFNKLKKPLYLRLKEVVRFISYCHWLLWEIVKANYHVIKLTLTLGPIEDVIDPHMFTFTSSLKSDFAIFILANSITLTPGTVTIRVHKNKFYIHALDYHTAGDLAEHGSDGEMEKRITRIFAEGGV
jgi:multicomponent Na+:H+ antiporter subunit E